jgi:hypothetical protein
MNSLSLILADLRTAIAARAARDRALSLLLVAVFGRIARLATRLERLVALWRAGKLPVPRAAQAKRDRTPGSKTRFRFPTAQGWLALHMREAMPFGTQLEHYLTDAECQAFLAAVPQAGRIVRPLLRMLVVVAAPARLPVVRPEWAAPAVTPVVTQGGLVIGSGERLAYV